LVNHFQDAPEIFIDVDIDDSNHKKAASLDHARALSIVNDLRFRAMSWAVDLGHKLAFEGYEIHDIPVDGMLTAKFPSREPTVAQPDPEVGFGTSLAGAKPACPVDKPFHPTHPAAGRPTSPQRGEV
jgi:hypothetical protein